MRVKEVADLVNISVRTLHHYDEIGLLTPAQITDAGYRLYSDTNLEMLQQILFFRELGLPLKSINAIINDSSFDRQEALELHRNMLLDKRSRLDTMIATIDKTIRHMKGEIQMSNKEKFKGFDFSHNPYEQEARARWGNAAVDKANTKIGSLSKEEQAGMSKEMVALYERMAAVRNSPPESEEAQSAIGEWYRFLNSKDYYYSLEAFKGLGQLYVNDERFTKNIDQFGDGLAQFMCDAMEVYVNNN
ncbi:MerR family transcriptional regulator [Paenibacillus hemerocallicola]|uniref:MerR family transcriptional regulator n=1 Tax=Paenibacillus hemerocallicola TaxID=1172614 RepID=A0A5C4TA54_9BACL|nr:MerR family transcriptional regulator [Paenibacillus hemerocallicola]TNJ65928.1 MerR family transcriptional regulator [Paenibacillus hemerocallicola]